MGRTTCLGKLFSKALAMIHLALENREMQTLSTVDESNSKKYPTVDSNTCRDVFGILPFYYCHLAGLRVCVRGGNG